MKRTDVVQPKPAFVPFNLLIETEDEARLLSALLGNCPDIVCTVLGIVSRPAYPMYKLLTDFNNPDFSLTINAD